MVFGEDSAANAVNPSHCDKWLTIDELAGYIKMGSTNLYGMAQRGEVPASKTPV